MSTGLHIAAVVVTHNRLKQLQRCIASLLSQSTPANAIVVVDNDSSDGTSEWLSATPEVVHLRQGNLGGAGGFHRGIGHAHAKGYRYIWALDDDGYPDPQCLEHLLAAANDERLYLAPLVLDETDDGTLAFALTGREHLPDARTAREAIHQSQGGLIDDYACPFNGVLLNRKLIDAIGLPDPRFFFWGDERDFTERARRAGHAPSTVVVARYYHPRDRYQAARFAFLGRSLHVPYVESPLKQYISERNNAYLSFKYRGMRGFLRHLTMYAAFYISRHEWKRALQSLIFAMHGVIGVWDYPQRRLMK
jgi:rhamnopyranosyl-N-acetylglucosaminyl-diphospho-decaprenol beta-1,3/1,4-galactofuranosyltransferase